ncbi:MAG: serine hydrolase domain-containing protein [Candidatus Hermodarchaeota archaeon]
MLRRKNWILILIPLLLASMILPITSAQFSINSTRDYWPTMGWRVSAPETQGLSSSGLEAFWNQLNSKSNVGGIVLIRNGYIVFEEYYPGVGSDYVWDLASATKSITAAVLGVALADGYLTSVNESVLDIFPERTIANPDPRKDAMTIHHLLTMSSGFESDAGLMGLSPDWLQYLLDLPMVREPGTFWRYDGGCSHFISTIVTRTTGLSMAGLAQVRLFGPMGITNYRWDADPQGNTIGFGNLAMTLRDLAKIGYLYLNNGTWGPFQLVTADWVAECTTPHFQFLSGTGYGYQWWIDSEISGYSMRGAGGKRAFVLPELDMVIALGGAKSVSFSDFYSAVNDILSPAVIGEPANYQPSVGEQTLPFVVVLLLIVIPVIIGNTYWQRKRS